MQPQSTHGETPRALSRLTEPQLWLLLDTVRRMPVSNKRHRKQRAKNALAIIEAIYDLWSNHSLWIQRGSPLERICKIFCGIDIMAEAVGGEA